MRRPGSASVVKIRSVLSFTHFATAKNTRSLATVSFLNNPHHSVLGRSVGVTLTTLCADMSELEGCKWKR